MDTSTSHRFDGDEPIRTYADPDGNHVAVYIGETPSPVALVWGRSTDPAAKAQQIRDLAAALVTLADALEPAPMLRSHNYKCPGCAADDDREDYYAEQVRFHSGECKWVKA